MWFFRMGNVKREWLCYVAVPTGLPQDRGVVTADSAAEAFAVHFGRSPEEMTSLGLLPRPLNEDYEKDGYGDGNERDVKISTEEVSVSFAPPSRGSRQHPYVPGLDLRTVAKKVADSKGYGGAVMSAAPPSTDWI